jgi:formamidopyrimidine-DNA glycosylase
MPELPEAETLRRSLVKKIKGKKIVDLTITLPTMVRRLISRKELIRRVRGNTVVAVKRRGKSLLVVLDSSDVLIVRLGMTGQLIWSSHQRPVNVDKYTHIIIHFGSEERVLFRDVRQFGEVYLTEKSNLEKILKMGTEPLTRGFTPEILGKITSSTVKIKNLLMDQRRIAGIGNIYSDEILFEAGIHPLKQACLLKRTELKDLHQAIGLVLREAIACKGDTFSDYRTLSGGQGTYQHFHRVYQREGEPCRRCRGSIVRFKLSGRSCHFCPSCQT